MRVLALETAFDVCGAAIVTEDGVEAVKDQRVPQRHNQVLAPMVDQLLKEAGFAFSDLDALALSAGPGSYTGLRIGMSYAKGLAFGTGLPIIPVPSLPVLLEGEGIDTPDWLAVWSHGENVYAIARNDSGDWGDNQFLSWSEFIEKAANRSVAGYLLDRFKPGSQISYVETCPSAAKVGKFAIKRSHEQVQDVTDLVPSYHEEYQVRLRKHADS
jgi:tRNA threonylcarbamoyl adenosine modification protein YeaZ